MTPSCPPAVTAASVPAGCTAPRTRTVPSAPVSVTDWQVVSTRPAHGAVRSNAVAGQRCTPVATVAGDCGLSVTDWVSRAWPNVVTAATR